MPHDEKRRPAASGAAHDQAGRPDESVTEWAQVYDCAEFWVRWNARQRWPDFTCNDQVWACSVTSWELHGRRVAA